MSVLITTLMHPLFHFQDAHLLGITNAFSETFLHQKIRLEAKNDEDKRGSGHWENTLMHLT